MNQEKIMKRKMITAFVLFGITLAALLVFIGLYIDETHRVQETYRKQFQTEISHASREIELYIAHQGDTEERYKRITSFVTCANSFLFLMNETSDKQIVLNEVTTCLIKYPEQMPGKMEELKKAFDDIYANLDKGYDEAKEVVNSVDKMGR